MYVKKNGFQVENMILQAILNHQTWIVGILLKLILYLVVLVIRKITHLDLLPKLMI